jgi:hypothetical protein
MENPSSPCQPCQLWRLRVQKATPRDFLVIQMWQIKIEFFEWGKKTTIP